MEHIISITVENKFGSLSRVAGLFSGRGFNIESLSVAPTLDPSMSQMTIVTSGDERIIEQIVKQLNKLIDVIKVVDLNESDFVSRETALIKVHTRSEDRAEALRIADIFRRNGFRRRRFARSREGEHRCQQDLHQRLRRESAENDGREHEVAAPCERATNSSRHHA